MTPTNKPNAAPDAPRKQRRRIVRRRAVSRRRPTAPPDDTPQEPGLTAKEYLALMLNDPDYRPQTGADIVAIFKNYVPNEVTQRVHDNIQKSRALDKRRALTEGHKHRERFAVSQQTIGTTFCRR
ncbi:MAG: hypothetical protein H7Y38_09415 [Armatimonadetes bacterium]|nr:hypothetical protein [Armatimonadota bacterium]